MPERHDAELTSFEEIREVLRSEDFLPDIDHPRSPLFTSTLLLLSGGEHLDRRKVQLQLFGRAAVRAIYEDAVVPHVRRALRFCVTQAPDPQSVPVDLVPVLRVMTYRFAASIAGIDVDDDDKESIGELIDIQDRISAGGGVSYGGTDIDRRLHDALDAREQFRSSFFNPSLERRRRLVEAGGTQVPRDILTLLCQDGSDFDYDTMVAETALYFVASVGNTSRTIPHALADLLAWFDRHPDDRTRSTNLTFLHDAATESVRLHPMSPNVWRRAARDVTLSTGRVIPKGSLVRMDVNRANHDPTVYGGDASVYDPYRASPPDKRWGMTFGDGRHTCIGKPMVIGTLSPQGVRANGIIAAVLEELFRHNVRLDSSSPQVRLEQDDFDYYTSYPVLLSTAAPGEVGGRRAIV